MSAENTTKPEASQTQSPQTPQEPVKPTNAAAVKRAVSLGKELGKQRDMTKADVARRMFDSIANEPREVIVQAFVDGAGLTPKGAQTYFYNCKRKAAKST